MRLIPANQLTFPCIYTHVRNEHKPTNFLINPQISDKRRQVIRNSKFYVSFVPKRTEDKRNRIQNYFVLSAEGLAKAKAFMILSKNQKKKNPKKPKACLSIVWSVWTKP